jgi:probable rRNA maturation factor
MKKKPSASPVFPKHPLPKIYVNNRQTAVRPSVKLVRAVVQHSIALEGFTCEEVTIHLVSKQKMRVLHLQFFDDPSVTDSMSFPLASSAQRISGDVFVCPAQAIDYTAGHGGDPLTETLLYIIHGLLHLMGYDDQSPKMRRAMRQAERRHLAAATQLMKGLHLGFNCSVK